MKPKQSQRGYACFEFVENKASHLCQVKFCRKEKAKGRRVCYAHHMLAWRIKHPLTSAYATLRDHAVRRNIKFTLTVKQFNKLVTDSGYLELKGNHKNDLHIDRIDSLQGYEMHNLQILTCSENSAKGATKDKSAYVAAKIERYRKTKKDIEADEHAAKHFYKQTDEDECLF